MSCESVIALSAAYFGSVVVGWILTGLCMVLMRYSLKQPQKFTWLKDLYIGGTERLIATTLTIAAPGLLPGFIGAWMAFKIAAHWQREAGEDASTGHLLALVGSAISFSIAIAAGLILNPDAIKVWNPPIENVSSRGSVDK